MPTLVGTYRGSFLLNREVLGGRLDLSLVGANLGWHIPSGRDQAFVRTKVRTHQKRFTAIRGFPTLPAPPWLRYAGALS
ncbi:hypothetical protein CCR98_00160 [Stenotrophomonas sp. WZN-1]|nr:hypothetical protein CCR98_00160 [Stenotrophomonas sp. WZN-1]